MNIEEEIDNLIGQMTVEEKVAMCHGSEPFRTGAIPRLGIPGLSMSDGPMGVRKEFLSESWTEKGLSNDFVSYLPSNMAVAATWSREKAHLFGETLGREARGRGKDIILAPGINIIRSPLGGRNFEYMSEDPHLIAELVVPLIEGIQENDVAACVKHFAANNHEENRMAISVEMDEQALQEIYLPGFKAAVTKAKSLTIMSAYNKFRGTHCSHNERLLKTILRDQWGFDGVVISDWGAVHDTKEAAEGGLDIEMHITTNYDNYFFANPYLKMLKEGVLSEEIINGQVRNILRLMFRLNLFSGKRKKGSFNTMENWQAALDIARESVVLLKNDTNRLPLPLESDNKRIRKILVIGENAQKVHSSGGGSAEIKALFEMSPLLGLTMIAGGNCTIEFQQGYSSDKNTSLEKSQSMIREASEMAGSYDDVLLFCGLNHEHDTEEFDRVNFNLPYRQDDLIASVLKANDRTIIINISGSPVAMPWISKASTVVQMFYSGMFSGQVIAEVLFGLVNPSGKMPLTFPVNLNDSPDHSLGEFHGGEIINYNEGIYTGYRYYDSYDVKPLFPFGHGLSYATFVYEKLDIVVKELKPLETEVTLSVQNKSDVEGSEVIQLYLRDIEASGKRPFKELKGFIKMDLKPDEKKSHTFILKEEDLSFYKKKEEKWIFEPGEFEVLCGASSRDIRLKKSITL
ncbi:MAG: glycoside hydrolase family 3 C-terminal domain-containing protein [Spirochaetaceae bacterium]|jgi:beta-glucosidase|nr:glycoside hydrolase family 3 C-terminal domain-containing protein [Spirochaetaceae bacterium]